MKQHVALSLATPIQAHHVIPNREAHEGSAASFASTAQVPKE